MKNVSVTWHWGKTPFGSFGNLNSCSHGYERGENKWDHLFHIKTHFLSGTTLTEGPSIEIQFTYSHSRIPFSKPPLKSLSPKHRPVTACRRNKLTEWVDWHVWTNELHEPLLLSPSFLHGKSWEWYKDKELLAIHQVALRWAALNTNKLDISRNHPEHKAQAA